MQDINLNSILDRCSIENKIIELIDDFNKNKSDLLKKRGIFIYGESGIGKTTFVSNIIKKIKCNEIYYDAGDVRNKSIIELITKKNMGDLDVISMFNKQKKNIIVVMDEIDGMNNGDKGGINSLIKVIRPKKTKKQKLEEYSHNMIICIGSTIIDKKIKELMSICHVFNLSSPAPFQCKNIINTLMPKVDESMYDIIINYVQRDLKKINILYDIYNNNLLSRDLIFNICKTKILNDDIKNITNSLYLNNYNITDHNVIINETNRTIIGLLWHENIIDFFKNNPEKNVKFYLKILDNICFSDYIDRITFQKQIWQFNEMSSLIKTFYNNYLFKNEYENIEKLPEIRFTKVLTKYSTEYNNILFINNMCFNLNMDKKDMLSFFIYHKKLSHDEIYSMLNNTEITKLDINRIYKYINLIN